MMKRVLIVSTKYPFPTDDGKKTVLAGFLAYLLDRCGRDHVTYIVVGRKGGQPAAEPACRTMWVAPPGRLTQIWNVFLSLCGLSQKSLQEALTYAPRIERMLAGIVSEAKRRFATRHAANGTVLLGIVFAQLSAGSIHGRSFLFAISKNAAHFGNE